MIFKDMNDLPKKQRILALDIGEKFIGVAISDINQSIASPIGTIVREKMTDFIPSFEELLIKEEAGALVIGFPLNMDGNIGPNAQSIKQFANNINKQIDIPIFLQDERMSTIAVDNAMLEADLSRQKRKKKKDQLAATYILQSALDRII